MLKHFSEFRGLLDRIMVQSFGKPIVLYGYGRSGRFIQWYAEYYHSLKVDYIITEDWSSNIPYEFPLFKNTLFDFNYGDVRNAIIWLAVPKYDDAVSVLEKHGYEKNKSYYNLCEIVYGNDIYVPEDKDATAFSKKKTGYRDIQFMEWLECKYGCNFVTRIEQKDFTGEKEGHAVYALSMQKEIFPILDRCHINPGEKNNAIFDFGCGKGGALVTFLDYGFTKVGGVEYEKNIFGICQDNLKRLELEDKVSVIEGDATAMSEELDEYNWFYFYSPFSAEIYEKVIPNIMGSIARNPRKVSVIVINPNVYEIFEQNGFILTNQFEISTRQRVVDVFVNRL